MFRQDVPEEMIKVLEKMMAKDPARRYQTPADVVAALAPWTQTPIPPPAPEEMPPLVSVGLTKPSSNISVQTVSGTPGTDPLPSNPRTQPRKVPVRLPQKS